MVTRDTRRGVDQGEDVDAFVLGIDLGGTKIALGTARVDGTILCTERLATDAFKGADQAVGRAIAAGQRLVASTAAETGGTLIGVGLSTMGVTREDHVVMAPNVSGWERLALPSLLRAAFPLTSITIDNDVKAATRAELRWGALVDSRTALYINLGTGIAAGVVTEGRVLAGTHGAAGEIAYNLRGLHDEVGAREQHAPLEEYAGGRAIGERATTLFGVPYTAQQLFARAREDAVARAIVEATLTEIAYHLTNLAIALDPERLAIGGGLMAAGDLILPRIRDHMTRFVPFPPEIVAARFVHEAGLMGAIALAHDEPRLT